MEQPLSLRSFPRAMLHIDADAFFASCEQAVNLKLKGKPVNLLQKSAKGGKSRS